LATPLFCLIKPVSNLQYVDNSINFRSTRNALGAAQKNVSQTMVVSASTVNFENRN